MSLGRPAVCYLREGDLKFLDPQMRSELPLVNTTPGSIYQTLRELLVEHKHRLAELGDKSRKYVEKWHNPKRIAARLKDSYETALSGGRDAARR